MKGHPMTNLHKGKPTRTLPKRQLLKVKLLRYSRKEIIVESDKMCQHKKQFPLIFGASRITIRDVDVSI